MPNIWKLDSWKPWMIVTLMAWIHGNEKSGQVVLSWFIQSIAIHSWVVYVIPFANPRAIQANVRQTEKNMNRVFHGIPEWTSYEDMRAQELLPILRQSDILLDVHNTLNTENSLPFLISEHPEWDQYFPVDTVVSWLDTLHPGGSDGYMNSIGKIGLCIESRSIHFDDEGKIARESILNFLKATGNIEGDPEIYAWQQKYHLDTIVKSETDTIRFVKKWLDFEPVKYDELIAYDGEREIRAPYDGVIVFTYETKKRWEEVCVFGRKK